MNHLQKAVHLVKFQVVFFYFMYHFRNKMPAFWDKIPRTPPVAGQRWMSWLTAMRDNTQPEALWDILRRFRSRPCSGWFWRGLKEVEKFTGLGAVRKQGWGCDLVSKYFLSSRWIEWRKMNAIARKDPAEGHYCGLEKCPPKARALNSGVQDLTLLGSSETSRGCSSVEWS